MQLSLARGNLSASSGRGPQSRLRAGALLAATALVAGALLPAAARAQDATWLANPGTGDFNTAANWDTAAVPTGTAFFDTSATTALSFSADTTIGGWTFNAGAPDYAFTNSQVLGFTGAGIVINGGSAAITNNGTLEFNNASTAGSAAITNDGGVEFFDNSTAGSAAITNNGILRFHDTSTADSATFTNNGILAFEQDSTAGSATITNNDRLEFRLDSTAGSAKLINNAGGTLNFRHDSTAGNAQLINNAAGTVDFSASTGPVDDGQISAGSIAGAGDYLLGSRTLTVGSNDLDTIVSGVISDCGASGNDCLAAGATGGSLVKTGTGTLTLSGANTYTGATDIDAGVLNVTGSLVSSVNVNAGGTLGGSGIVGNTNIGGGTLSPGNSIGTLNVQGSLTFTAASTYLVEVDPNGADLTNVSGAATLGGATVSAIYANGAYVTRRYTIVNATGGVIGTFNSLVNTNLPANFTPSLAYDGSNAYLDLTLNFTPPPPPGPTPPNFGNALSGNQTNVANALVNSFNTAGGIPLAFGALTPQGLTQVSGEAATGTQQTTFDAMDRFLNVMTDPFMGTRAGGAPQVGATGYADDDEALAYASKRKGRNPAEQDAYAAMARKAPPRALFERRWSVWGAGYGGTQSTDGNAATGSNDVTSRIYGAAAGLDYRLTPATLVGFSLGGAGTKYDLANGLGGGRSELFQAGVYGRHHFGPAYVAGALAYGWQDVTTERNVFLNSLRANFDANAISGRLEGGYRTAFGASGLTPYAAGQFTTFFLPDYAEQVVAGTNLFALSYAEKDVTASRTELGLRADTSFAMQDAVVTLRGRAAWAHNFNADRSISAIFQTLPASGFVVNGAAQAEDSALVSAAAETKWLNGFSVAASFEGEFSNVTDSYAGKGIVRYQW